MPHLEFTILPPGFPQTKDKTALKTWKDVIRAEAAKHWAGSHR